MCIFFIAAKSEFRSCPYKGIYDIKKVSKSISWNDVASSSKKNFNVSIIFRGPKRTYNNERCQTYDYFLVPGGLVDH